MFTKQKYDMIKSVLKDNGITSADIDAYIKVKELKHEVHVGASDLTEDEIYAEANSPKTVEPTIVYSAEYFLDKVELTKPISVKVGDYLLTNIGIEKVISVSKNSIITEDADIDYATANIIDIRKNSQPISQVYRRNPKDIEPSHKSEFYNDIRLDKADDVLSMLK